DGKAKNLTAKISADQSIWYNKENTGCRLRHRGIFKNMRFRRMGNKWSRARSQGKKKSQRFANYPNWRRRRSAKNGKKYFWNNQLVACVGTCLPSKRKNRRIETSIAAQWKIN